jgi:flagellar protein FlgJ
MTPQTFIAKLKPYAQICEEETGISSIFTLAQAALESGWGKFAPGNMYFGIKDNDGLNGNEQLLTTTEYFADPNHKFPEHVQVWSCKPVVTKSGKTTYKFIIKTYFRKYDSPVESFIHHGKLLMNAKRNGQLVYGRALPLRNDPEAFARAIAPIYATGPEYANTLISVIKTIRKYY